MKLHDLLISDSQQVLYWFKAGFGQKWKPNTSKFGSVFNLNMLSAILDGSHYQESHAYHSSTVKYRDFKQKPNASDFESIFNLNMLQVLVILDRNLTWVKSKFMLSKSNCVWVKSNFTCLNLTFHRLNLISMSYQLVAKVKFFTPWYLILEII